jgi:hypothetical protein
MTCVYSMHIVVVKFRYLHTNKPKWQFFAFFHIWSIYSTLIASESQNIPWIYRPALFRDNNAKKYSSVIFQGMQYPLNFEADFAFICCDFIIGFPRWVDK